MSGASDSQRPSSDELAEAEGMAATRALPRMEPAEVQVALGADAEELKKSGGIVTAIFVLVRHLYQRFVEFMARVAAEARLQQENWGSVRAMERTVQAVQTAFENAPQALQAILEQVRGIAQTASRVERKLGEPTALSDHDRGTLDLVQKGIVRVEAALARPAAGSDESGELPQEARDLLNRVERALGSITLSGGDRALLTRVETALTASNDLPEETRKLLGQVRTALTAEFEVPDALGALLTRIDRGLPGLATTTALDQLGDRFDVVVRRLGEVESSLQTAGSQPSGMPKSWLVRFGIGVVLLLAVIFCSVGGAHIAETFFKRMSSGAVGESEGEVTDTAKADSLEAKTEQLERVSNDLATELRVMRERRHLRCPLSARNDDGEINETQCEMVLGLDPEPGHLKCPHDAVRTDGTIDRARCVEGPQP